MREILYIIGIITGGITIVAISPESEETEWERAIHAQQQLMQELYQQHLDDRATKAVRW